MYTWLTRPPALLPPPSPPPPRWGWRGQGREDAILPTHARSVILCYPFPPTDRVGWRFFYADLIPLSPSRGRGREELNPQESLKTFFPQIDARKPPILFEESTSISLIPPSPSQEARQRLSPKTHRAHHPISISRDFRPYDHQTQKPLVEDQLFSPWVLERLICYGKEL